MKIAYVLAAMLSLVSSGAYAGPQFGEVKRLCLQTHADPAAALATADAEGWTSVPRDERGREGRAKVIGATALTLRVEERTAPVGGRGQICTVIARPADNELFAQAATWANVEPLPKNDHSAMYNFIEEEDGRHTPFIGPDGKMATDTTHQRTLAVMLLNGETTAFAINTVPVKKPN